MKKRCFRFVALAMAALLTVTAGMSEIALAAPVSESAVITEENISDNTIDNDLEKSLENDSKDKTSDNLENETEDIPEDETEVSEADECAEDTESEKLNFVYLESKFIETSGTQNVLVSFGSEETVLSKAQLTVKNYETNETNIYGSDVVMGNTALFSLEYSDESKTGIYQITDVSICTEDSQVTEEIHLSETGMENIYFGVNKEVVEVDEKVNAASIDMQIVALSDEGQNNMDTLSETIEGALENGSEELDINSGLMGKSRRVDANADGDIVVVLDPGHDATHGGARANGLKEEELTLKIAKYCKAELEEYYGVKVYMTRETSACPYPGTKSTVDNANRVEYAKSVGADAYVSIHLNSSTNNSVNGAEVFYPNANYNSGIGSQGSNIANLIERKLTALGLTNRGISIRNSADGTTYPDGSLADYYGVIRLSKLAGFPGIIIEHAYLTSGKDAAFLSNEDNLKSLGIADATGIAEYFELSKTPANITASKVWVSSANAERNRGSFVVQIDGITPLTAVNKIKVAAFTKADGSDIHWYDAINYGNGTYAITVESKYHQNNSGCYIAQAYAEKKNGALVLLGTVSCNLKFEKPKAPSFAKVTVENANSQEGTFDVFIRDIVSDGAIEKVKVDVYTSDDNKVTYPAEKQSDGSYKISVDIKKHKSKYGTYHIDTYATDEYGQEAKISPLNSDFFRPVADIRSVWHNGVEMIVTQNVGIDSSISSMTYAVWNDELGRDSMRLYAAIQQDDGRWVACVPIADYKKTGSYTAQLGITDSNGGFKWERTTTFTVAGGTAMGNVQFTNVDSNNGSFDVVLGNVTTAGGVTNVRLAVWCEGASDLYGYSTFKSGDYYLAHVDNANHKYHYGKYVVQIFVTDKNGVEMLMCTKAVQLAEPNVFLATTDNGNAGTFGIVASNLGNASAIADTVIAVWSNENGQDDLTLSKGYPVGNGVYIATADVAFHKSYGDYTIQLGVVYKDGTTSWKKSIQHSVDKPSAGSLECGALGIGQTFYGRVYDIKAQMGIRDVTATVWSKSDRSDKWTYKMVPDSDGSYLVIGSPAYHNNNSGLYNMQINVVDRNGTSTTVKSGMFNLDANGSFTQIDTSAMYTIMGESNVNVAQMVRYYNSKASYPSFYAGSDAPTIEDMCRIYYEECQSEGVRAEVAFVQMLKETNYLRYTGDVSISQYNFAGIGATGNGVKGNSFANVRTGVRAQVQHLKAYATSDALNSPCVDPRYDRVKKGSAPYVQWLGIQENPSGGGWAAARNYGYQIVEVISSLINY